jgi:dual specificity phosphatase 12
VDDSSQAITQSGFLSNNSVTHILSVCEDQVSIIRRTPPIVQYRIGVPDADETNLLVWLPIACQFIHEALTNGGVVVVHSSEGECRAPAVVAAYRKRTGT